MKFTWIPFYKEFAEKLLNYRNDRKSLLKMIYDHREQFLANYLHDQDGEDDLCPDIDPFTTMGLFNRGIKLNRDIQLIPTLYFLKTAKYQIVLREKWSWRII